jgi:hypothetical protein
MNEHLHGGFTGVAWAYEHLERVASGALTDRPSPEDGDPLEEIDEAIDDFVIDKNRFTKHSPGNYDLIGGLVGFGVYALERLPCVRAVSCLEHILSRLAAAAEHSAQGVTWLTPVELLPDHQRVECPEGYYNLGLAHGVPGVIVFLARMAEAGLAVNHARTLLDRAVRWLLAQRLPATFHSVFPSWTGPSVRPEGTRLAWCYGDLGVATALLCAARAVGETTWETEALGIARLAAERRGADAGIVDAPLCHGAAGAGHCFNRLYQATREPIFRDAACYWLARSLEMWPERDSYDSLKVWDNPTSSWKVKAGVLDGAGGIALALLAATTSVEPAWDRSLLISSSSPALS